MSQVAEISERRAIIRNETGEKLDLFCMNANKVVDLAALIEFMPVSVENKFTDVLAQLNGAEISGLSQSDKKMLGVVIGIRNMELVRRLIAQELPGYEWTERLRHKMQNWLNKLKQCFASFHHEITSTIAKLYISLQQITASVPMHA